MVKVSVRFLLRRARRYGRACVNFGAPLDVDAWLAERPGVLELPREERLPRLKELADEVMRRIAAIMPVTPVPLAATALLRHPGDHITRAAWEGILDRLRAHAPATPAPTSWARRGRAPRSSTGRLIMLTLRRVVQPEGDGYRIDRVQDPLLHYYASSIAHFFEI